MSNSQNNITKDKNCTQKGEGGGEEMVWEFGAIRCKLLCIERIYNRVLLYSTWNYIQYPVINCNEKEYKKEHYVKLNHFAVEYKLT